MTHRGAVISFETLGRGRWEEKTVYIVKNKWCDNTGGYMTLLKVAH